ncbi:MAG: LVIVD repeat-containing protein [Thermoplasmatota archaeon]
MQAFARAAAIACTLLLLAGCFGGDDRPDYATIETSVAAAAAPVLLQSHDSETGHFDGSLHQGSWNLELVAYHNGVDQSGDPAAINAVAPLGYYTEMAVTDNFAYLSRQSADGTYGGFAIVDIRNASAPRLEGEFLGLGSADIEVNDDESLAFLATQRNLPPEIAGSVQGSQDPRSGLPRGIYIVDIEQKDAPALDSFFPLPVNGPHTLTWFRHPIDGQQYLVTCTYDLVTDPVTNALVGTIPVTQRVLLHRVVQEPGSPAALVPVGQFTIAEQAPAGKLYMPHDTRVQVHPSYEGGARVLLYIAYWDKGMRILDITTPTSPQMTEIGRTADFSPSALNNLHLAQPFDELIADRHVSVTQPEIPQVDGETGQLTFFDTTDPTAPTKLGHWTLPPGEQGQLGITGFDFSPHNFDTWDGKVALGHFHAGVWVIDVGDEENLAEPKSVGFYMPAKPRADSPARQPNVWGVFEHEVGGESLLFAIDEATGLYILRYTGP